ncbi:MAG: rhodanese-like domain-containing protein [Dehalococcoidia bacterium]
MEFIRRDELKEKLDRGDDLKLVMVLDDWHFRAMHIPGSLQILATEIGHDGLNVDDEIVVYCAHKACPASMIAYNRLKSLGYQNVRRYAGGVFEWEQAGYPVEGEMAK